MTSSNAPTLVQPVQPIADDEIDLRQVVAALLRQKKLIAGVAGSALLLSGLYAFTREPVWQGEFQIVLESQDSGSGGRLAALAAANPMLANLAGVGGSGDSHLETEVTVLESPSVLKPTYDFVKASKAQQGVDVSNWSFPDWRDDNLDIELEKGTSVLNIAYRDTDPDLVLPVIERISRDYQSYSGRDRQRGLTQGVTYLTQQVEELREQANQSMRQAQAYALKNELGLQDGMPTVSASGQDSAGTSVEGSREQAQQRVNALQQQLIAARGAGNRTVFQAPQLEANAELYSQLQTLEANLQQKQSLLKPNDDAIRRLQRQRQNLIAYINRQTIGLLEGELITAQSQLSSLNRPRDVVLKHRELVRTALRDEKTLAELENQLQTLQLEQARQTDPWELISTPTLLDKPVAPRKKRMVALGLLGGLVLGCGAALIRDRRSGLVFSEDELGAALPGPQLERLSLQAPETWLQAAELLADGPLQGANTVALIPVGSPDPQWQQTLNNNLQSALGQRSLVISNDLVQTRNCDTQVLLVQPGEVSRTQLAQLKQSLALQGTPVAGWLLLDPNETAA
jgi:succinoglycan biosynthesis transport protein ExoP